MYNGLKPITVDVISDIHCYSKKVGTVGKGFEKANAKSTFDLLHNEEIMDALAKQLINDKTTDIVLVSGDLTNNGEPASHEDAINFLKKLQDGGKRVFVITATHDYQDDNETDAYNESGTYKIKTPPREELLEMYRSFGPDEAIAVHKKSMSYIVQLCDGYRLFALNDDKNGEGHSGFDEETFNWIAEQIEKAKKDGQFIIAMTHHPLISPSPFYSIIGKNDMMGGHLKRREAFADLGLNVILTGHTHIQDISYCFSENGNIFYDITTASPVGYPGTYRTVTYDPQNGVVDVKAREITEKPDFEMKGDTLREHLRKKFFGMVSDVIDAAASDIPALARMVTAFSVKPKLIYKIGWLIKPVAKLLKKLKVKHAAKLCRKETGLKSADYADIADEKVVQFILSLVENLYGGDSPYTPDTAYYKITMGVCSVIDSILSALHIKLSKIVKGADSVSDLFEPLLYNSGICDEAARLDLNAKPNDFENHSNQINSVNKSKKGAAIITAIVIAVIVLLPLILLYLLIGFIVNSLRFRKELGKDA